MYAYDRDAMVATDLDQYRVGYVLAFQHTHEDTLDLVDADTLTLEGPRGAAEFARMWALYRTQGIMADRLQDALGIVIGVRPWHSTYVPGHNVTAQRQMLGILRWLLACAGYGEDVLQDAIIAAMEDCDVWVTRSPFPTVGEIMAHTPDVITQRDWHNTEPLRSSTPFEWLS